MLSKLLKIFFYGIVNFLVILGLISITKFNMDSSIQSQLFHSCVIIFVTGLVDYIIVNKKF